MEGQECHYFMTAKVTPVLLQEATGAGGGKVGGGGGGH